MALVRLIIISIINISGEKREGAFVRAVIMQIAGVYANKRAHH